MIVVEHVNFSPVIDTVGKCTASASWGFWLQSDKWELHDEMIMEES